MKLHDSVTNKIAIKRFIGFNGSQTTILFT